MKKKQSDFALQYYEQKSSIIRLLKQIENEDDLFIKKCIYEVIIEKYKNLLSLIDRGVNENKDEIKKEKKQIQEKLERIKDETI